MTASNFDALLDALFDNGVSAQKYGDHIWIPLHDRSVAAPVIAQFDGWVLAMRGACYIGKDNQ